MNSYRQNREEDAGNCLVCTDERLRFFGRTYWDEETKAQYFNWSCSGFVFCFEGTSVRAKFLTDWEEGNYEGYLLVRVDFKTVTASEKILKIDRSGAFYSLANGLEAGRHTVEVYRITECQYASVGLKQLLCDGSFLSPPSSPVRPRIEFIGDSITCGFGILSADPQEKFSTALEHGMLTFAALTAQELNCDFQVFSVSGWAINQSPFGGCLPSIYDKLDAFHDKTERAWSFAEHPVDMVVLGLGTNDSNWTGSDTERLDAFEKQYSEFLGVLRERYPYASIVCVLGSLIEVGHPIIKKVQQAIAQRHDCHISFLTFKRAMENNGEIGCSHPNLIKHREMADTLKAKIQNELPPKYFME